MMTNKELEVAVHMVNEPELTRCYELYAELQHTADLSTKLTDICPNVVSLVEITTGVTNDRIRNDAERSRKSLERLVALYFKKKVEDGSIMDSIN